MKRLLIILTVMANFCEAQILTGTLVDSETGKPEFVASMSIPRTAYGLTVDSTGQFIFNIHGSDSIEIMSIQHSSHLIYNLPSDIDTVKLGTIALVYRGFNGYVTTSKKRLFSKKTKLECKHIDTTRELSETDLTVNCSDGKLSYKWVLAESKRTLSLDFEKINYCAQHPLK